MTSDPQVTDGWAWFDAGADAAENDQIKDLFEAVFTTPAGRLALAHLRRTFLERRISPSSSDAVLRHMEGSRFCHCLYRTPRPQQRF